MMFRALFWIRSRLLRWDLAALIQASGAYSNTGQIKPLYRATRPWWFSTRTARCKKLRRCLGCVLIRWRLWRKARLESNITPSSFMYSVTATAVPPNVMGGSGSCWRALERTRSWLWAGSNLMRHCLPQSCKLSRVCCNAAAFSRRSLESARVYTVVSSAKELSRVSETRHLSVSATYSRKSVSPSTLPWRTPACIGCSAGILQPPSPHRYLEVATRQVVPQPGNQEPRGTRLLEFVDYPTIRYPIKHPSNIYCNDGYSAAVCDCLCPFVLKRGKNISRAAALMKPIPAVRKEMVAIQEGNKLIFHDDLHNLW